MGLEAGGGGGGGSVGGGAVGSGGGVLVGGAVVAVAVGLGVSVGAGDGVLVGVDEGTAVSVGVIVSVGSGAGVFVAGCSVAALVTALTACVSYKSTLAVAAKVGIGPRLNEETLLVTVVTKRPIAPVIPMMTRERSRRFLMMFSPEELP